MNKWDDYYIRTKDNDPSYILHLALFKVNLKTGHAIDLGCGNGADTFLLIEKGWTVTSIDFQEKALKNTYERILPEKRCNLTLIKEKFEDVDLPKADLVIANDSLSFCTPNQFPALWNKIRDAINPEGRFAGNFFGKRDGLVNNQHSFFELDEIKEMFKGFNTEIFFGKYEEGPTSSGELWNVFYVVAKKSKANSLSI